MNNGNKNNLQGGSNSHSGNKKEEYLKDKTSDLEGNCNSKKIRNVYRGIRKKGDKPRIWKT
jgi:hypothetical protein